MIDGSTDPPMPDMENKSRKSESTSDKMSSTTEPTSTTEKTMKHGEDSMKNGEDSMKNGDDSMKHGDSMKNEPKLETTTENVATAASLDVANASNVLNQNMTKVLSVADINSADNNNASSFINMTALLASINKFTCKGDLVFRIVKPDLGKAINFSQTTTAPSASDCAILCYERNCSVAGYAPRSGNESATCLFAFEVDSDCGQNREITDYNDDIVVELHCVRCRPKGEIAQSAFWTRSTPASATSRPPMNDKTIKPVRHCVEDFSFITSSGELSLHEVAKTTSVRSARACALECYAHGCTQALFNSSKYHVSEIDSVDGYPCALSFDPQECPSDAHRVNHTDKNEPTLIICVECSKFRNIFLNIAFDAELQSFQAWLNPS